MENINLIWWTGVVEDRNDPEKLGRCRVRIFGFHTDDVSSLPTEKLPWATPVQPINSAATSGIGFSPTGIVEGSWVIGWFLDGEEAQRPIIIGTLAGKPAINAQTEEKLLQDKKEKNVLRDSLGNPVFDSSGNPIQLVTSNTPIEESFQPLNSQQFNSILNVLGTRVSSNSYSKVGSNNELGKYQLDVTNLILLGYVKNQGTRVPSSDILDSAENWANKEGITTKQGFLSSSIVQEKAVRELMKRNYDTLIRLGKITDKDDVASVGGLLLSSYLVGAKNADKLDKKTDAGVPARDFFILGNSTLGGNETEFDREFIDVKNYLAEAENDLLNNQTLRQNRGFQDPNKKYPKYEYAGKSDVNKLAVGDTSHLSFTVKENNKIEKIAIARSNQTWDEPDTGYAAVYPYNQVIETEAGHLIELDSTPNAERVHIYHKKGTYIEIDVNGSMVRKVVGDNYEVIDRNNFVYVKGANNLTVEGKTNILVKNDASIEVHGGLNVTSHGSAIVQAADTLGLNADNIVISGKNGVDITSSGAINIQGKGINQYSKDAPMTLKSNQDMSLQSGSGSSLSLKGGLTAMLDAVIIKTKMGANNIRAMALAVLDPPSKKTPSTTSVPVLKRVLARDESFLFDSGEAGSEEYAQSQIEQGKILDTIAPKTSVTASLGSDSPRQTITPVDSTEVLGYDTFPRSFKLSKYFYLSDLLVGNRGTALVAQKGLTEAEIVDNLRVLAVNCLDPIKQKYLDMVITSGFRVGTENSDHNIGAAADLMFRKTDFDEYVNIANWIYDNVPFKQLLLEYRFNDSSSKLEVAWIHISLQVQNGSIVKASRNPVATFKNHRVFVRNQLVNLA